MGIFDKFKKLKNYIAGTGAELQIIIDESSLANDSVVRVKVLCQVKEHDILVDKLYLKLKAEETVRYMDNNNYTNVNKRARSPGATNKTSYAITYKDEVVIDQNFRLSEGGEFEWDAEFTIPANIPGTYLGVNARHEWKILAGLSKKGNDPDSGWVIFQV